MKKKLLVARVHLLTGLGFDGLLTLLTSMAFLTDLALLRSSIHRGLVVTLDGRHGLSTKTGNADLQGLESRLVDFGRFHEFSHFFLDEAKVFAIVFLLSKKSTWNLLRIIAFKFSRCWIATSLLRRFSVRRELVFYIKKLLLEWYN